MVDIKRQIRESKNEVESIKNLREVVNMVLKNFTGLNNDLKQQSKLVEVEFKYMSVAPPGTNEEVDLFEQEMNAITSRHQLAITSVTSDEDEDIDEDGEDNPGLAGILALQETDTSVDTEVDVTPVEIYSYDVVVETTAPIEVPEVLEAPSLEIPEIPERLSTPEDDGLSLELPDDSSSLELPEDSSSFSLPEEAEEIPDEPTPENIVVITQAPPEEIDSTEETESGDEYTTFSMPSEFNDGDLPFILAPDFDSSADVEPDPDLPMLSLDGFSMPEGVPEVPVKVAKETPKKVTEAPVASTPMVSDEFQVASVTAVDPKVSKHFAEEIEASTPKTEVKPEPTGTAKPIEKKAPADIDAVLALLGV
jgi:hypothetical protein